MLEFFWFLIGSAILSGIIFTSVWIFIQLLPFFALFIEVFRFFLNMMGYHHISLVLFSMVLGLYVTVQIYWWIRAFLSGNPSSAIDSAKK